MDRPVPIACADCAANPAASSSVSDALNTPSTLPKNSTRRLARVGPRPGVSVSASHESWLGVALATGSGTGDAGSDVAMNRLLRAQLYAAQKGQVKVMHHMFDKIFFVASGSWLLAFSFSKPGSCHSSGRNRVPGFFAVGEWVCWKLTPGS